MCPVHTMPGEASLSEKLRFQHIFHPNENKNFCCWKSVFEKLAETAFMHDVVRFALASSSLATLSVRIEYKQVKIEGCEQSKTVGQAVEIN